MEKLMFTKVREVKSPNRANSGDAGIDFYIPYLTIEEILQVGESGNSKKGINRFMYDKGQLSFISTPTTIIVKLRPGARLLIPSGVRVLIDPKESMLMAANKSGVATQTGLIYTAQVVDSPYIGEVHIGILNTSNEEVQVSLTDGTKIMQFIHVPVILSTPIEITNAQYESLAKDWGTRGSNGFGSTDNK